jgi:hypothetical protein
MPRAKAFKADEALQKAMHVFWEHGYEATSVQCLVEGMSINRFSLYSTFGNKHQLLWPCWNATVTQLWWYCRSLSKTAAPAFAPISERMI